MESTSEDVNDASSSIEKRHACHPLIEKCPKSTENRQQSQEESRRTQGEKELKETEVQEKDNSTSPEICSVDVTDAKAVDSSIEEVKRNSEGAEQLEEIPTGLDTKNASFEQIESESVKRVRQPHPHDVLLGRGSGIFQHEGNKTFRNWIRNRRGKYIRAISKDEKSKIAREVTDLLKGLDPPGRFLQHDPSSKESGESWVETSDVKAMMKTNKALREGSQLHLNKQQAKKAQKAKKGEELKAVSSEKITQQFFVIKSCEFLEAPAIFLSNKDYNFFLEENENSSVNIDCKVFQDIVSAVNYISPGLLKLKQHPSMLDNDSLLDIEGTNRKKNDSTVSQRLRKRNSGEYGSPATLNNPKLKTSMSSLKFDGDSNATLYEGSPSGNNEITAAQQVITASKRCKANDKKYFEKRFEHNFNLLKEYKKEYHTIDIPLKHESVSRGKFLGLDLTVQNFRKQINLHNSDQSKSELTQQQVQQLIDIGFVLRKSTRKVGDKREIKFQEKFSILVQYKEKYNTIYIPSNHPSTEDGSGFEGLYRWLSEMRRQLRLFRHKEDESTLSETQVERLEEIGFESTSSKQRNLLKFDRMLQLLSEYKDKYNTCYIPLKHENVAKGTGFDSLDVWCSRMRQQMKLYEEKPGNSSLTKDQMQRLKDLGFVENVSRGPYAGFDPETQYARKKKQFVEMFVEKYQELLIFKDKNGHTNVPYRSGGPLIFWIKIVRQEYAKMKNGEKTMLSADMVSKLLGLGFELNLKQNAKFETRALEWLEFCQKNGRHPKKGTEDDIEESLARWVGRIRAHYHDFKAGKPTTLEPDQIDQLNQWGFKWSGGIKKPAIRAKKKSWIERYQELLGYKELNGDTIVPQHYPELGLWVSAQRKEYHRMLQGRKSSMTDDQLDKLKSIGFVWKVRGNSQKRSATSARNNLSSKRAKLTPVNNAVETNDNNVGTDEEDDCIDYTNHDFLSSTNKEETRHYYQQMAQQQATTAMYATNYSQHWNNVPTTYL